MLKFAKPFVKNTLYWYTKRVCKQEFENQKFTRFNERAVEFGFVFKCISKTNPHRILDVGTGKTALPHLMQNCGCIVTATDNVCDYWPSGMTNRHFHIIDDDITATRLVDKFDLVTCVSVLEHIQKPDDAVRNMFSLLKPNGHVVLTFPYNEENYIRNVYELPGSSYGQENPNITQSFSRHELAQWSEENNAKIVDQQYWQFWNGDYWTVGEQVLPPRLVKPTELHQHTCLLFRKV